MYTYTFSVSFSTWVSNQRDDKMFLQVFFFSFAIGLTFITDITY